MFKPNDVIKIYKNEIFLTKATVVKISDNIIYCIDSRGPFFFNIEDESITTEVLNE